MTDRLTQAVREWITQPLVPGLTAAIVVFAALLAPGGFLAELPLWQRIAFNSLNALVYLAVGYAFLGPWIGFALGRGLSWFVAQVLFYLPLGVLNALVHEILVAGRLGWGQIGWIVVATSLMIVAAVGLVLLALRPKVERVLAEAGFPGCLFLHRLPPEEAAPPAPALKLRGANQYVEFIRADGTELVRMSLRDAIAAMPPGAGVQVHRSVWVAWDHIAEVFRENGNTRVRDGHQEVEPVSRANAAFVQAEFERRRSA